MLNMRNGYKDKSGMLRSMIRQRMSKMPKMPSMPKAPSMPKMPSMPKAPSMPETPKLDNLQSVIKNRRNSILKRGEKIASIARSNAKMRLDKAKNRVAQRRSMILDMIRRRKEAMTNRRNQLMKRMRGSANRVKRFM